MFSEDIKLGYWSIAFKCFWDIYILRLWELLVTCRYQQQSPIICLVKTFNFVIGRLRLNVFETFPIVLIGVAGHLL